MSRALLIDSWRKVHSASIVASFQRVGREGRLWRVDWKRNQSAVFHTRVGAGGGGVKIKVNPDGDMVRKRGGVMNSPVREGGR